MFGLGLGSRFGLKTRFRVCPEFIFETSMRAGFWSLRRSGLRLESFRVRVRIRFKIRFRVKVRVRVKVGVRVKLRVMVKVRVS